MTGPIQRKVYDAIPVTGVYERDLLQKMVGRFSHGSIESALAWLLQRGYIKKAGDKSRPIYVRSETAKVVYTNIKALRPEVTETMRTMHSNFEENPR